MGHMEFIGKVQADGTFLLPEQYRETFLPGSKVRVLLQPLHNIKGGDEEQAVSSGHGPTGWQGSGQDYGSATTESLLLVAAEDWKDWADPEEDIYDDFRERLAQG